MSQRVAGAFLLGMSIFVVNACAAPAVDSSVPSDVVAACVDEGNVECAKQESCEGGWATLVYGSVEQCAARLASSCEVSFGASGASFGSAELTTCTANEQAQTCDEWLGAPTPGCGYAGIAQQGAACVFNSECQTGFCQLPDTLSVCGACAAQPAEGDACTVSCGGDGSLACEEAADGTSQCVQRGALGASCDYAAQCAAGLGCATTCQPATGVEGDSCDDNAGPLCDSRQLIYCNAQTQLCQKASMATPGQTCGVSDDGSFAVCAGGVCVPGTIQNPISKCTAFVADGQPCNGDPLTTPCEPPAVCYAGGCRIAGNICD